MYYLLQTPSLHALVTPSDVLAGLIAAAGHDVAHTGTNNAFHIASGSELALRYNDVSVLENMHASYTCQLLKVCGVAWRGVRCVGKRFLSCL
jgi:hypothetical protein